MDPRPLSHRMILACSPDKPRAEQTREVVTRLLNRGYRRPATAEDIGAHVGAQKVHKRAHCCYRVRAIEHS